MAISPIKRVLSLRNYNSIAKALLLGLLLLPAVMYGQGFESKIQSAEKLMANGQYAKAKYQLILAIGDETPSSLNKINSTNPGLVERASNDVLETRIRTGELAPAMDSFKEQIVFKDYDEGIRHFHLECMMMRQKAMRAYYGTNLSIQRGLRQAETAYSLLRQNKSYIKNYSSLELVAQEDLLIAYFESERKSDLTRLLSQMKEKAERIPYGSANWPAYYWLFKTLESVSSVNNTSDTTIKLERVLKHLLQFEPSQAYIPFYALSRILERQNKSEELHKLVESVYSTAHDNTLSMLRSMIEYDRYAIGRDNSSLRINNLLTSLPEGTFEDVLYDLALFSKNVLLDLYRETANNVYALKDDTLSEEFRKMQFYSGDVSSWYQNILFLQRYELKNPPVSSMRYSWREVQRQLQDHDVAIEFIRTGRNYEDYSAAIIRKGWKRPKVVRLCSNDEMSRLNCDAGTHRGSSAQKAFETILTPLQPFIAPGEHIFYSPDGRIAQLNLDAFQDKQGRIAGDLYHLHRVRTTRVLPTINQSTTFDHLTVFGGMEYDASYNDILDETLPFHKAEPLLVLEKRSTPSGQFYFGLTNEGERASYSPLPYSYEEAAVIYNAWSNPQTRYGFAKVQAVEEMFKYCVSKSSPKDNDIFHIATHSFQLPETEYVYGLSREEEAFKKEGLLFSGAAHAIRKEQLPDNMNDQLLYSEEIGRMDLRCADLVVLSACNTARGEDSYDGILGLQRAFKRSGARTIVMTLWNVNDLATTVFMSVFYRALFAGKTKYDAFYSAQKQVRDIYDDPYYWAPFIMLD